MDKEAMIAEARRLKAEGLTYTFIGERLGVSRKTVSFWLNPKLAEGRREYERLRKQIPEVAGRKREQNRKHWRKRLSTPKGQQENRERSSAWRATLEGRFKAALATGRASAQRNDYKPCNATLEQLAEAFDGHCAICGIAEADCSRRLCMDHCHETGDFRGWLCDRCNTGLGKFRDDPVAALNYLRPDLAQILLQALAA